MGRRLRRLDRRTCHCILEPWYVCLLSQECIKLTSTADSSVSGSRLGAAGSPLLAHFIRETAQQIPHPTDEGRTLWDARQDSGTLFGLLNNSTYEVEQEAIAIREMEIAAADSVGVSPLGSGSDYTVFLQRSGVGLQNFLVFGLHRDQPDYITRYPAQMADSVPHFTTLFTIIIPFLIPRDGKSYMPTQDSIVTYVLLNNI